MRAPSQTAPTALMSPHAGNDQRSVTESRGRHRPEEPDTTARGHSDRSRREGCGTEKVLGGSRNSGSGTLLITAAFQRNWPGGSRTNNLLD
jgi:hypothetical protein